VPAHSQIYCTPQCCPGKSASEIKSYQPIGLPPVISKLFEKLPLKRIRNDVSLSAIIPDHQFGFREGHSTIQRTHRIVNKIISLEGKHCIAGFLNVAQAFYKVWHTGLLYKIKNTVPSPY
jgi:hypothetical protein